MQSTRKNSINFDVKNLASAPINATKNILHIHISEKQIWFVFFLAFLQIIRQTNTNVHKITTMQQIEGCKSAEMTIDRRDQGPTSNIKGFRSALNPRTEPPPPLGCSDMQKTACHCVGNATTSGIGHRRRHSPPRGRSRASLAFFM